MRDFRTRFVVRGEDVEKKKAFYYDARDDLMHAIETRRTLASRSETFTAIPTRQQYPPHLAVHDHK